MSNLFIAYVRVVNLFGLYTYDLEIPSEYSEASILYGDNGVGKSTVLRLAFHLLSAADDRGHRAALYETKFEYLEVGLDSGVVLSARRDGEFLRLRIAHGGSPIAGWDYMPRKGYVSDNGIVVAHDDYIRVYYDSSSNEKSKRKRVDSFVSKSKYMAALEASAPTVFILNADRRLDSDAVSDPSDEVEYRKMMRSSEPKKISDLVVRSREIALSQALNTASRWINKETLIGANQGSMDAHSVYLNVVRHLVQPVREWEGPLESRDESIAHEIRSLIDRLAWIQDRTHELARFEMATPLNTEEFIELLLSAKGVDSQVVVGVLKPYVESLEGRLEALNGVYSVVDKFIWLVNGFLNDKSISYTLSAGFAIGNRLGEPLLPAHLSSGEQQLLLLFCYVLAARSGSSIFMIDEPEISLNIKWQRALIQALLDITKGAKIQFVFASHSMELLSQHRNRVVKLEDVV